MCPGLELLRREKYIYELLWCPAVAGLICFDHVNMMGIPELRAEILALRAVGGSKL